MATNALLLNVDGERVADTLQTARERLDTAEGELLLDLSSVNRINTAGLRAMEALAAAAQDKSIRIALRGVNVEVYKVLKLVRLAPRFSFLN